MNTTKVYFLYCKKTNLVKIGVSDDIQQRIKAIQANSPTQLALLAIIPDNDGFTLEQKIHQKLSNFRKHGEWFRVVGDVKKLIQVVNNKTYTDLYEFLDYEFFNPSKIDSDSSKKRPVKIKNTKPNLALSQSDLMLMSFNERKKFTNQKRSKKVKPKARKLRRSDDTKANLRKKLLNKSISYSTLKERGILVPYSPKGY